MLYRGMDRAALDVAYNNIKAVPDFQALFAGFQSRSASLYEEKSCDRDLRYGPAARQRFDVFRAAKNDAPTVIYIHGGYWQTLNKEDFAFVAQGPLDLGYGVVLAEYTLAPEASMTGIVKEIDRLLEHLVAKRLELGIGRGPLCLIGHSAGGHLSLVHRSHPSIAHTMAISPLVDLEPIALSWLNGKLNLTPDEIERYSPIRHIDLGAATTVAVGADELPELVRHASEYAAAASKTEPVSYLALDRQNHFTILEELANASGRLSQALAARFS